MTENDSKLIRSVHPKPVSLKPGNEPAVQPIYSSVKYTFDSYGGVEAFTAGKNPGFFYSRVSSPTTRSLEETVAELQGREDALSFGSGLSAIFSLLISLAQPGDTIVFPLQGYKPTRMISREFLKKFGVTGVSVDITDLARLEELFSTKKVRAFIFESPSNPMTRLIDLDKVTSLARRYGVTTILDNTFGTPLQHGEFLIDYYIHSLTKYCSGHGDVLGGIVISDSERIAMLRRDALLFGTCLEALSAAEILRGIRTLPLRFKEQSEIAHTVASFLESSPEVGELLYPGLPSHPEHELAIRQMPLGAGAVMAYTLRCKPEELHRFFDKLDFIKVSASLGGVDTVTAPALALYGSDLTKEEQASAGITPTTFRLSVGLEGADAIIRALERGFKNLRG